MIDSLTFHNFKAFSDQTVPFGALTLLTGLNGTGKSTVLQALAMLRQSYDAGFLDRRGWLLNGELTELGIGRDVAFDDAADDTMSISVTGRDLPGNAIITKTSLVDRKPDGDVLWARLTGREQATGWSELSVFRPEFQYLRADRITPAVTFQKSQHAVNTRRFLGSRGEFVAHYLFEHGDSNIPCTTLMREDREPSGRLLSQVNAWMQDVSPGVRIEIHNVPMTDFVRLEFAFKTRGAAYGVALRPTNVGFGLTHVLPVIVACLASPPGSLILIENPEAQLHPQGQVAVGRLLAKLGATGVQAIVETHSDHILNGVRLGIRKREVQADAIKFHFFSRDDDARLIMRSPKVDENGLLDDWPSGFFTQWDETLLELLS